MFDITVVTPSYNQGHYIDNCLESIKLQNIKDLSIQHIIIDALSKDDTRDKIKRYTELNPEIEVVWISEADSGHQEAISKGVAMASGKYIAVCNTSDFYFPDQLRTLIDELEDRDADCIWGKTVVVKEQNKGSFDIVGIGGKKGHQIPDDANYGLRFFKEYKIGFIECTAVFKIDVLKSLMPLTNTHHPWLKIQRDFYCNGYFSSFYGDEPVAVTRRHDDSITVDIGGTIEQECFENHNALIKGLQLIRKDK